MCVQCTVKEREGSFCGGPDAEDVVEESDVEVGLLGALCHGFFLPLCHKDVSICGGKFLPHGRSFNLEEESFVKFEVVSREIYFEEF